MNYFSLFFEALINLFTDNNKYFTGVVEDSRTAAEIQQDFLHEERSVAAPVNPFSNQQITQSPYPYENQNNTSSCVPHAVGLALAIERKMDTQQYQRLGWLFNYRQRTNYPQEGTALQDSFNNYRKFGAPLYTTVPDVQEEGQANQLFLTPQMYNEAAIFKGLNYFTVQNCNDIDTLASIAQAGHAVSILLYASYDEYALNFPIVLNQKLTKESAEVRHCVSILPQSGFIKDGVKYVAVQDSAWFGSWKVRYLSEYFIRARCYSAFYWDTVSVLGNGQRPKYTFTKILKVGDKSDEVKMMQQLLIAEGLLPSTANTGLFAGLTLAAVNAFQSRYSSDILAPNGLLKPTGLWGNACISKANSLCNP